MNNGNNPKIVGIELLKDVQVLYQSKAISTEEKNSMASFIREGMSEGTFYKLNQKLLEVLDTISLPQVVEDMIQKTF